MSLAEWEADAPGCDVCMKFWANRGKPPPCGACDRPEVLPANALALELINEWGGAFYDGFGGVNLGAIDTACRLAGLDADMAREQARKITAFLTAHKRAAGSAMREKSNG